MAEIDASSMGPSQEVVNKAMADLMTTNPGGPLVPHAFKTLFEAGWKLGSDTRDADPTAMCPPDQVLKLQVMGNHGDVPVPDHVKLAYFKAGVHAGLKAE